MSDADNSSVATDTTTQEICSIWYDILDDEREVISSGEFPNP